MYARITGCLGRRASNVIAALDKSKKIGELCPCWLLKLPHGSLTNGHEVGVKAAGNVASQTRQSLARFAETEETRQHVIIRSVKRT